MTSVLVDASNLTSGGAVQVAASFVDECVAIAGSPIDGDVPTWLPNAQFEVSQCVWDNLVSSKRSRLDIRVANRPARRIGSWFHQAPRVDVLFKVFGPDFVRSSARRHILGCADVTAFYPRPEGARSPGPRASLRAALHGAAARRSFGRADELVVETTEMARAVRSVFGAKAPAVSVVPNTYNDIFNRPENWERIPRRPIAMARQHADALLALPTRAYPHKNIDFLGPLAEQLQERHRVTVRYVLTLRQNEWAGLLPSTRRASANAGPLTVRQLPELYRACDAAIFPSLLEAFSATPIEAMKSNVPLFASDRMFVKSICADAPIYFDPLSAQAAADVIGPALKDAEKLKRACARGDQVVATLPTSRDRAVSFMERISAHI